jgi:hypothetical protein
LPSWREESRLLWMSSRSRAELRPAAMARQFGKRNDLSSDLQIGKRIYSAWKERCRSALPV